MDFDTIEASILELTTLRGPGKSICPSEVARAVTAEPGPWQSAMPAVRQVAVRLALAGRIEITRKGRAVDPNAFRGVIRLRTVAA